MFMLASLFLNNRSQAVRLSANVKFDDSVKQVSVRVVGKERILSPIENTWDSFFLATEQASDDFMQERPLQMQAERESF